MNTHKDDTSFLGLIPLLFFAMIFIFFGLYTGSFYTIPVLVVFALTTFFSFLISKKHSYEEKLEAFCLGAGEKNIILMILIFLLAGIFAEVSKAIGATDAAVYWCSYFIPNQFMSIGLFLTAVAISMAMGSGVGTIVSLMPIASGLSKELSLSVELLAGAIVGGAMFGDNLSFISDTTIAAVRTQGCQMRDKFKSNFLIVLPAALITILLYLLLNTSSHSEVDLVSRNAHLAGHSLWMLFPYLTVLILALAGIGVLQVLTIGIFLSFLLGLFKGKFTLTMALTTTGIGIDSMLNLSILSMISGGLVGLIQLYGGPQYILGKIKKHIQSTKMAEMAIAFIVSLTDLSTANNTVSIIMVGPLAKNIATEYNISPARSASLLDIFAAAFQGIIPYGAQILVAAQIANISPFSIMKYLYYPYLMLGAGILSILLTKTKNNHAN